MVDIKKVKHALLQAFNNAELPLERIAGEDVLDTVLAQYFARASHMPKELTLEAIVNSLNAESHDKQVSHARVREILDKFR